MGRARIQGLDGKGVVWQIAVPVKADPDWTADLLRRCRSAVLAVCEEMNPPEGQ